MNTYWHKHPRGFANECGVLVAINQEEERALLELGYERITTRQLRQHNPTAAAVVLRPLCTWTQEDEFYYLAKDAIESLAPERMTKRQLMAVAAIPGINRLYSDHLAEIWYREG